MSYALLADLMAGLHVAYVAVVVFGLVLILVGHALGWRWVGNRWFRGIHLAMIVGVVIRAAIWTECPMTWWEEALRERAKGHGPVGSKLGLFLHDLIHPDLPMWVFPVVYVIFAALVVAAFWLVPVRWRPRRGGQPLTATPAAPPSPSGRCTVSPRR